MKKVWPQWVAGIGGMYICVYINIGMHMRVYINTHSLHRFLEYNVHKYDSCDFNKCVLYM